MTKLIFDSKENKSVNVGLDHGVLYVGKNRLGVPWNGLISVEDVKEESVEPIYLDGVKVSHLDKQADPKVIITAFTYPEEFDMCQGVDSETALEFTNQTMELFHICYRTLIKTMFKETPDYQFHIFYNLSLTRDAIEHETYSSQPNVVTFKWTAHSMPETINGFTPTSHVIFDSRYLDADLFGYVNYLLTDGSLFYSSVQSAEIDVLAENKGTLTPASVLELAIDNPNIKEATVSPYIPQMNGVQLPTLQQLLNIVTSFDPVSLTPNVLTGYSEIGSGPLDLTATETSGIYRALPSSRLVPSDFDNFYLHLAAEE